MTNLPLAAEWAVLDYIVWGLLAIVLVGMSALLVVMVTAQIREWRESSAGAMLKRDGKDPVSLAYARYQAADAEYQEAFREPLPGPTRIAR